MWNSPVAKVVGELSMPTASTARPPRITSLIVCAEASPTNDAPRHAASAKSRAPPPPKRDDEGFLVALIMRVTATLGAPAPRRHDQCVGGGGGGDSRWRRPRPACDE